MFTEKCWKTGVLYIKCYKLHSFANKGINKEIKAYVQPIYLKYAIYTHARMYVRVARNMPTGGQYA